MSDTRRTLLDALAEGPVSGPDLADRLGVSRAAVWKHVESLRDDGFGVESTSDGYTITDVPEYGGPAIEYGLEADYDVEFHEVLASSNDRARELAADGATDVAVIAREQSASKGRKGREWSAPDGGVWMSLLVRPDEPPAHAPLYTLAMAVAVCDAAREAGVDASIKWPNDVIVSRPPQRATNDGSSGASASDGGIASEASNRSADSGESDRGYKKLCGILTEMEGEADRISWLIIGPGTNVNLDPETLPEGATSIAAEAGPVERRVFVQRVLERFEELRDDLDSVLLAWRERADTLGRQVRVHTASGVVEGKAVDVEHPGTLVVQTDEGETRVHAGDCEHLRPATDDSR
ncbi:bifunctional biotin--[acetyl-CoA-carboxylase] synthetase/biotin operon repressor [Haloferax mediterranei ATCC 33500]|uniref:Bifunctional biotin--[acetyl-CoA-carboxylase] synthetase/biotin operon repressor n=1 Tax=Haloferax mediterranei (strain ATCC 33500 / DSM 1411 / JCM 8866 / NBRC 14739 / NCIMB 2177 / R-4) TaxID=523841 RepID=I3R7G2_HALMT|nr:bifunctional biotin--[acetyl-CoA-carboxylase] synthetase/biotin operon repressor [Haloferax mediterranei]AFK20172.1 BirA family transcriptional regulator, biotin operon repressor / biotin-[acetyl-CoA-carboxylase] ligase [Haloferax mediterranei ATCC 33500]AHZ23546.1 biotin--acetyl-CoA-carboxylase ligase [Haloferax mediterranei ATCC 33500]ELZ99721.1 biotin--acetyl-CoA-carboxylase ligase [Haloferax mediterranei ATCC 33500]MDX5987075.1 bifunctional biotin--[acetyl-CoA-carboxylase] synthetase/bio